MPYETALQQELQGIINKIHAYLPDFNEHRFIEAFDFAKAAHGGQLRKSGEPYITHPLRTVLILERLHVDEDTLIAALLHDVPEDTRVTLEEIEKTFGQTIAYLVDGITKLKKVHYQSNMADRQIESLKKLFIHSAEDLRVILIKLADRLHNMRTLQFVVDTKKRMRIARETIEIYVPIANLLGIGEIRSELEDLCFQHLYPEHYEKLKREIEENVEERNFILDEMIHLTKKELKKHNITAEVSGRPKTFYSVYLKLQSRQNVGAIDDLIAIRVIVPTRKDCYLVLGIIHNLFKPKIERLKDYIAVPKPNGYQSLHTTVFGLNGSSAEYQIRTRYMHLEAEYGIAAHYFYKYSSEDELTDIMQKRSSWVQRILEIQRTEPDNKAFMKNLRLDIFQDRIFTFTPKGDVIDLPRSGSAIDFAYAIHTDIGNRAVKAEINGALYSLITPLNNGDTVRIITAPHQRPQREWLAHVKTNLADEKIRDELKKLPREEKMEIGKRFLQKEFDHIGKHFIDELTNRKLHALKKTFKYENLEDILVAVGEGTLLPRTILETLYAAEDLRPHLHARDKITQIELTIESGGHPLPLRTVLTTFSALHADILELKNDERKHHCRVLLRVQNYDELSQIFESLEQIEGVASVKRTFPEHRLMAGFLIFAPAVASILSIIGYIMYRATH